MVISTVPICSKDYDSQTIISVIMQLEIENQSNQPGMSDMAKDIFSKYYTKTYTPSEFLAPICYLAFVNYIPEDARDLRSFYPTVPTPPPNC